MRSQILTLTLLGLLAGTPVLAGDHDHGKANAKGHRRAFCPHCGEACYPTVTKGKETKVCFETETKTICIPKVRFPWEKDCGKGGHGSGQCAHGKNGDLCPDVNCVTPKCGRTKHVNVLLKHEYECTVCKYSWDPSKFENGEKKEGPYLDDGEPASDEAAAPAPPSVEARRPATRVYVQPASAVPRVDTQPARTTRREGGASVFSRFFK